MAHETHASAHAAHPAHGEQHYVKVWALLCGLLVISIIGPMIGIRAVTLITAFGIAIVKASMVARHFMHVNVEKRWVVYALLGMVAFMVVLFWGVAPDVMEHQGHRWQKLYAEPAAAPAHAE